MTDEEMEKMQKMMQFIVEQQAQFASDMMQMKEAEAKSAEDRRQHTEDIKQLTDAETNLMRAMTTVVGMAGDHQGRITRLETAMAELASRVSAFIAALGNGKPKTS